MDVLGSEGYLKEQWRPNREFGVALGAAAFAQAVAWGGSVQGK